MECAEFRRLFGTDPKRTEPEVLRHRASCTAGCAHYARDLERVDALVLRALEVAPPAAAPPPWEIERRRAARGYRARWYALAASVLLVVVVGLAVLLTGQRRAALIAEVVQHADHERNVMVPTGKRVDLEKVRRTLAAGGAVLLNELPISIARTCKIRGVVAPHLILQTRDGAVAVLLLRKQRLFMSHEFEEQGYEGTLLPKGDHSIAVIGTSKAAVDEGTALVDGAVTWPKDASR